MSIYRFAIATLTALGMMALTATSASALQLGECNPQEDPDNCQCPSNLASYQSCNVTGLDQLIEFDDPSAVDTSFISTSYDSEQDNYDVVIDLRQVNGAGLVPQLDNRGEWDSIAQLKSYIAELTGVPATEDHRLTPFDMTQIGYSTAVTGEGFAAHQFNDFILDLITDQYGVIEIAGVSYDLGEMDAANKEGWQGENEDYIFDETLATDGNCKYPETETSNGHTFGFTQCSLVEAKSFKGFSSGIYNVETEIYDVTIDGDDSYRIVFDGPNGRTVRTIQVMGDLSIDSRTFVEYTDLQGNTIVSEHGYSPFLTPQVYAPALVQKKDRAQPYGDAPNPADYLDGICSDPGKVGVTVAGEYTSMEQQTGDGVVTANSSCPR